MSYTCSKFRGTYRSLTIRIRVNNFLIVNVFWISAVVVQKAEPGNVAHSGVAAGVRAAAAPTAGHLPHL